MKEILLDIASADANEVLRWGKEQVQGGKSEIKMSTPLSRAVSSIKMKASSDGIDCEVKLLDKLKAIELYFKLCSDNGGGASDGTLYIDYDYRSSEMKVDTE